jgi:hypothetical protein
MDLAKVLSKLKKALYSLEETRECLESLVTEGDEQKKALVRALIRVDDALRLLDDALVEVEVEWFEKTQRAREVAVS